MALTVKRGNVELTVPDDTRNEYLELGYDVIEKGKVVETGKADTAVEVEKLTKENEKLKKENEKLKKEIADLKKEATAIK